MSARVRASSPRGGLAGRARPGRDAPLRLADACAARDRADDEGAFAAAEDALQGATLAIFAAIGERHPTRMEGVWRSVLRR